MTKDGEKFQIYVEKILATLNEIEHNFDKQETSSGKIDIGIVETITKLPMLLSMFRKNSPHVSLSLHTDVTANISKNSQSKLRLWICHWFQTSSSYK